MNDVGLAGGAHLALVVLDAEFPGLADQGNVFIGSIGQHLAEKFLETLVDLGLREEAAGVGNGRLRLGRHGDRGRLDRSLCLGDRWIGYGLPDRRHASL